MSEELELSFQFFLVLLKYRRDIPFFDEWQTPLSVLFGFIDDQHRLFLDELRPTKCFQFFLVLLR